MSYTAVSPRRGPRAFLPLIIVLGPVLSALTLTALGYAMFQAQATANTASQPAPATLSGPLEYTVILALAGALVSLLVAMLGLALYSKARKGADAQEKALAEGLERLTAIDRITNRIAERGERREAAAGAWARRQRDAFAQLNSMTGPRAALQRITGDIWAGISHPGAPLDAPTALAMARESAIASAALGAALDDLRSFMASSPAEVDAIEAIDDALVEDLIALEELARQTHSALILAAGAHDSLADRGSSRLDDKADAPPHAPAPPKRRPAATPPGMRPNEPRPTPRTADFAPPPPSFEGDRPPAKDAERAWPPPVSGRSTGGQGPSAQHNMRPAGSSGQWSRRPRDAEGFRGGDPSVRGHEPRDRDDSSSRWLND